MVSRSACRTAPILAIASLVALLPAAALSEPDPQLLTPAEQGDFVAARQLADTIAAVNAGKRRYVEEWNATAADCEARRQGAFGGLASSCRQAVKALARGEIFRFAFECRQLLSRHDAIAAAAPSNAASANDSELKALLTYSRDELATFCGKDFLQDEYPAFAAMLLEAEARAAGASRSVGVVRTSVETDRFNILPPTVVTEAPLMEQPFIALPAAQ